MILIKTINYKKFKAYSDLVFATIWGKVFFGVWPSYLNAFGMFLIASSGILIALREKIKTKNQQRK